MELTRALDVRPKEVVSFVGGGGKTAAMFRLAEELVVRGKRVVTTTTTRIFAAQIKLAPFHIFAGNDAQALHDLREALKEHKHVLLIGMTNSEGKAFGVSPSLVDQIAVMDEVDVVIDEADGSRMRPFKAPGDHEPVVPASTTLLVPVVGIDAIGVTLDDVHVHRSEMAARLAGVQVGTIVEPELVAKVIAHSDGGLKNRPAHARVIPLINKAENVAQLLVARDIAGQLLRDERIDSVVIGAVKNAAMPAAELFRRVVAIVLAAGGSTRMQGPLKQLLPWGDSTLLGHTLAEVRNSQVADLILVVGKNAEMIERELGIVQGKVTFNPDWEKGRSTSVHAGLNSIASTAAAAIFVNADQPFLTSNVIDTLLHRYYQTLAPIVVPMYNGKTGSPVLFAREMFGELMQLTGEDGGKRILLTRSAELERVNIVNVRAAVDLDTMEQYRAALADFEADPSDGIASTVPSRD
jgi:molybdenum cofactor cytidylyltransferase